MSAQDNLGPQFMMHINDVARARSGDVPTHSMGELANDDYARWQLNQTSKYSDDSVQEKLTDDVSQHGVREPISMHLPSTYSDDAVPIVDDGHHRFMAAWDSGEVTHVPVNASPEAVKRIKYLRFKGSNFSGEG